MIKDISFNTTVNVPIEIYNALLQAYYFAKACKLCGIEEWDKYHDVELMHTLLATDDSINDNNKE